MFAYLVFISLVCYYIYLKLLRRWERQKNRPSLMPGALPIIGHAYMLLGDSKMTVMGLDYEKENIDQNKEFKQTASRLYELIYKRLITYWMLSDFLYNLSKTKTETDQAIKIAHNYVDEIIKKKKAALIEANCINNPTETGSKFKSYLDLVLDLSLNGSMTDNEIRDEVNTMVAVGFDTTAVTLVNTLIMIGSYPHVQKCVYDELKEVLGNNNEDVKNDDLEKLVYLDAVIKEVLRLYPIAPVIARCAEKEIQLKNCCLPAGSTCFLLMYALHRHPIWGPDAGEFKPERWLSPTLLPDHPGAYAAFSIGRRSCIGTKFAMTSLKTALSHIVRRYEISADYTKVKLALNVVLEPASGHHIALEYRTN